MKKITMAFVILGLSLTILPAPSYASVSKSSASVPVAATSEAAKANVLLLRLDEINRMPKENLSAPEKKELKAEVISIRKELRDSGGGIYLSLGAIIIILLLLIILF